MTSTASRTTHSAVTTTSNQTTNVATSQLVDISSLRSVLTELNEHVRHQTTRIDVIDNTLTSLSSTIHSLQGEMRHLNDYTSKLALREEVGVIKSLLNNNDNRLRSVEQNNINLNDSVRNISIEQTTTKLILDKLNKIILTKADISLMELKANNNVVNTISASVNNTENEVNLIKNLIKQLQNSQMDLRREVDGSSPDKINALNIQFENLNNQLNLLKRKVDENDLNTLKQQQLKDEISLFDYKISQIKENILGENKTELKKFENDVMVYVTDALTSSSSSSRRPTTSNSSSNSNNNNNTIQAANNLHHNHNNNVPSTAALSVVHYKCLSCGELHDQTNGAATQRYAKATCKDQPVISDYQTYNDQILMSESIGNQVYIHGTDGNVYLGRVDDTMGLPVYTEDDDDEPALESTADTKSKTVNIRPSSAFGSLRPTSAYARTSVTGSNSLGLDQLNLNASGAEESKESYILHKTVVMGPAEATERAAAPATMFSFRSLPNERVDGSRTFRDRSIHRTQKASVNTSGFNSRPQTAIGGRWKTTGL